MSGGHLVDPGFPRFTDPFVTTSFCDDVQIFSNDGFVFALNGALLAASHPALRNILIDGGPVDLSAAVSVSTELSADRLQAFLDFIVLGEIPARDNKELEATFRCFGINLEELTFTAKSPRRRESPRCSKAAAAPYYHQKGP